MPRNMERDIAFNNKVKTLQEILHRGPWKDEEDLMSCIIGCHPGRFSGLTPRDLDQCIQDGNKVLIDTGNSPVLPNPEDDPGRCDDIWKGSQTESTEKRPRFKTGGDGIPVMPAVPEFHSAILSAVAEHSDELSAEEIELSDEWFDE